jgi:hypothetical protein
MNDPITARAELAQRPPTVFDLLADLRNHALLAPGSVQLRSRDLSTERPVEAIVRLRGRLAIRRTASTAIVDARAPAVIRGRASIGKRTQATISWTPVSRRDNTSIALRVTVEETGFLDSVLPRLAGRGWLQRRFADALACLAHQFAAAVPNTSTREGLPVRSALQPAP